MRLVADTNVLVSAFLWRGAPGAPRMIWVGVRYQFDMPVPKN